MNNYITGEKIQSKCLTLLLPNENLHVPYNPNIKSFDCILANEIRENFDNPRKIFCYSYYLKNLDLLISILQKFKNIFSLILHNSDENFEIEHCILFKRLNNLEKVYTQNCNIVYNNVEPIPIGIANEMWNHGNLNILNEIMMSNIQKINKMYFNFFVETNKNKREICKRICISKKIEWNQNNDFKNYLIELSSNYYAICPEGNGIDTHRLWECLYLNVIPICLKNNFLEYFINKFDFDIILLNDWEELNVEKLTNRISNNNSKMIEYEKYLWNIL